MAGEGRRFPRRTIATHNRHLKPAWLHPLTSKPSGNRLDIWHSLPWCPAFSIQSKSGHDLLSYMLEAYFVFIASQVSQLRAYLQGAQYLLLFYFFYWKYFLFFCKKRRFYICRVSLVISSELMLNIETPTVLFLYQEFYVLNMLNLLDVYIFHNHMDIFISFAAACWVKDGE